MTEGEHVREVWYLNDAVFLDYAFVWEKETDGYFSTYLPNNAEAMPPGEYYLEVYAGESDRLIGTSEPVTITGN